jgi:hypothetical protein
MQALTSSCVVGQTARINCASIVVIAILQRMHDFSSMNIATVLSAWILIIDLNECRMITISAYSIANIVCALVIIVAHIRLKIAFVVGAATIKCALVIIETISIFDTAIFNWTTSTLVCCQITI